MIMENEEKNTVGEPKPTFEIDYDKIINGVFEKLNTKEIVETQDIQPVNNIPEDKSIKLNEDYFNRAIEFETKYNNKEKEYNELLAKKLELDNLVAEQNKKLQEYSAFGKTSEEIVQNSRKLEQVDRQLSGLRKL